MHTKRLSITSIILILALASLACNLSAGKSKPTSTTKAAASATSAGISLGEEYRSEVGGYTFRSVPDYSLEETEGYVFIVAPDGDATNGPAIFMIGSARYESMTLEELYDEQIQNLTPGDDVEISPPRDVTVGSAPGRMVDISGLNDDGQQMVGQITFVLVNPNQVFLIGAMSPTGRWEQVSAILASVQGSVTFFEPSVAGGSTGGSQPKGDQIRQWAKYAYASSSRGDPNWHASQAKGAPDTQGETCADASTAWAPAESNTVEWLELVYETRVIPTEINIIQTHASDQVVKVELIDAAGLYRKTYTANPTDHTNECPYTLTIPLVVDFEVGGLKITVDQTVLGTSWNGIDAVELVGFPTEEVVVPPEQTTATPEEPTATSTATTEEPTATSIVTTDPLPDIPVLTLQDPPLSNDTVGQIKFRLAELGYEICMITTNFYNQQTEAAVRHFQAVNGLDANGIVDQQTLDALLGENAIAAPPVEVVAWFPDVRFPVMDGVAMVSNGIILGILDEMGAIHVFDMATGEYAGSYLPESLPGEEVYQANAFLFDGQYLWIAQQGDGDGILQAYDIANAEPVEGRLKPIFDESIHFPSYGMHHALASDGKRIWVLTEDPTLEQLSIQPIDLSSRTAGHPIRLGMSAGDGSGSGYSLTYDSDTGLLWAVYGDDIFGESGVVWVDPDSGQVGKALGPCGTKAIYAGGYILVAHYNNTPWATLDNPLVWVVDPSTGEIVAQIPLEGRLLAMATDGTQVWLMTYDDMTYEASLLMVNILP